MHGTRKHLVSLMALLVFTVLGSASRIWAQDVELSARKDKAINGIEAELRGDFRESNGIPTRLDAELENINLPIGTPVAFCVKNAITLVNMKIGVGKVALKSGILTAEVELSTNDGDVVPQVNVGDKLHARQSAVAPFNTNPGCGSPLLVAAKFQ